MAPNGQLPAYEWNFGDVNPPVQAWAAMRVYHIEKAYHGKGDRAFLEKSFKNSSSILPGGLIERTVQGAIFLKVAFWD